VYSVVDSLFLFLSSYSRLGLETILHQDEFPLSGGNVNTVVRVGDTVRRGLTPNSATVHRLLLHLQDKGFDGCPRFLGIDAQNREILSFVNGETGIPPSIWQSAEALVATARLLRRYHDATVDFTPTDNATWAYRYPDPARHEVICHNDFAPYNFVYKDGVPIAIVDFDLVGPGPRLKDVAYAAYWTVPLSFHSVDQKEYAAADAQQGSRRLHLFCKTYGIPADSDLLDMIDEVLARMGDESTMQQMVGHEAAARLKREGHLGHWQREAAAFQQHRARIEANLAGDDSASEIGFEHTRTLGRPSTHR
jgi:hypothetical protein